MTNCCSLEMQNVLKDILIVLCLLNNLLSYSGISERFGYISLIRIGIEIRLYIFHPLPITYASGYMSCLQR